MNSSVVNGIVLTPSSFMVTLWLCENKERLMKMEIEKLNLDSVVPCHQNRLI